MSLALETPRPLLAVPVVAPGGSLSLAAAERALVDLVLMRAGPARGSMGRTRSGPGTLSPSETSGSGARRAPAFLFWDPVTRRRGAEG